MVASGIDEGLIGARGEKRASDWVREEASVRASRAGVYARGSGGVGGGGEWKREWGEEW